MFWVCNWQAITYTHIPLAKGNAMGKTKVKEQRDTLRPKMKQWKGESAGE